jgi:hypothetical protein
MGYAQTVADSSRVRNLIAALEDMDALWGAERTRRADELIGQAEETLRAEGDLGVWQQTRPGNGTRKSVAEALGVSVPYVQKRASRHSMRRR